MSIMICKHCNVQFSLVGKNKGWGANHTRWCDSNPKKLEYIEKLSKARMLKKNFNNQYSYGHKCSDSTKKKISEHNMGKKHSEETKKILREKALASSHRRLKRNIINYKGVLLDSTWELELAKRLDELEIVWVRPEPIKWIDDCGVEHNYFPDFYLVDYDWFLDPKNPHAVKVQKKKLDLLLTQYKNIFIIDTVEGCRTFNIKMLG